MPRAPPTAFTTTGSRRAWPRSPSCCRRVTRNPKSERPLSTRFADHRPPVRILGAAAVALVLAGCGASTPRQAEVKPVPAVVAPPADSATSAEPSRRERRAAEKAVDAKTAPAEKTAAAAPKAAEPSRKD